MITCKVMVAAEGIVRDAETNNISVFNILENLSVTSFPLFMQKLYVLCYIRREDGDPTQIDCEIKVSINDDELVAMPLRLDFLDQNVNRATGLIQGLAIPSPGTLHFVFLYDGSELNSYTITVKKTGKPETTTTTTV